MNDELIKLALELATKKRRAGEREVLCAQSGTLCEELCEVAILRLS